ncbi:MAG: hypothetical protein ACKVT0_17125 [Planctomycetaceae bacterium]
MRVLLLISFFVVGCGGEKVPTEHDHYIGDHSGIIVSVGSDHYHVEVLFAEGEMRFYTLDHDQEVVLPVPEQELTAYVRTADALEAVTVKMRAVPQVGDPQGQTSQFVGKLPDAVLGQDAIITVPNIAFGEKRYRFACQLKAEKHRQSMPDKVVDEEERQLYLTAGGKYTEADITANGKQTASQKYAGFKSSHDFKPKAGDAICPITKTKANDACTWIVDGKEYRFCCPPCIDEFVKLAKTNSDTIEPPDNYRQR